MTANWGDREVRELLSLRADEEISRNITGTVKDGPILEQLAKKLKDRGISRGKSQVTSKLKTLRKKYYQINERYGWCGEGRLDWQYFDLCKNIWGSSRPENRFAFGDNMDEQAQVEPCSPEPCSSHAYISVNNAGLDTEGSRNEDSLPCDGPKYQPPNKRLKQTKAQLVTDEIRELIGEMDRDEEGRARLLEEEHRAYEARLRKEARATREADRRERAEQTQQLGGLLNDILREMRVQSSLLRDLVACKPLPVPQTPDRQLVEDHQANAATERKPLN